MQKLFKHLLMSMLALSPLSSYAELTINGFLSVSGGTLLDDDIGTYIGYDDDWNTDPDTTFGLQVNYQLNEKVSATGQLIAKGTNDYDIEAEWAYMTYSVNDNWDIRVGKLRAPFFLYSDFLDVGYAYTWIRPPSRTYRIPFSSVSGIDTLYRSQLGDWDSQFQAFYGRYDDDRQFEIKLTNFTGANWTLNRDWLTLRAGFTYSDLTVGIPTIEPLLQGIEAAGFPGVAETLRVNDDESIFASLAFTVDYNDWLVVGEATFSIRDEQTLLSDTDSYIFMVGKRFGDFTVHATVDSFKSDNDYDFLNAIPSGVNASLDTLKATARSVIGVDDASNYSVGLRYDFAPSTAFKVELMRINDDVANADGTLLAFSIDMVF